MGSWVTILWILAASVISIFLIVALVQFSKMGFGKYERARQKARELFHKNQVDKAKAKIGKALKNIGWDYFGLLEARKAKRLVGIEGLRSIFYRPAIKMKFIAPGTIQWAVPGLLLLGEIFEKEENFEVAYKLYEDVSDYMEGEGDLMPRIARARAETELKARMSAIDLRNGSYLSAVRNHAAHILENIHLSKLENNEIELRAKYPYEGDEKLDELLEKLERSEFKEQVIEAINRGVNVGMGRVQVERAQARLNNLLSGRVSVNAKTREATRSMIQSVLEKAAEKDRKDQGDDDEGDNGKNDDDVILL